MDHLTDICKNPIFGDFALFPVPAEKPSSDHFAWLKEELIAAFEQESRKEAASMDSDDIVSSSSDEDIDHDFDGDDGGKQTLLRKRSDR